MKTLKNKVPEEKKKQSFPLPIIKKKKNAWNE